MHGIPVLHVDFTARRYVSAAYALTQSCLSTRSQYSVKRLNIYIIWLLTTPSHLKYVATVPCNLSIMACLADINVSLIS